MPIIPDSGYELPADITSFGNPSAGQIAEAANYTTPSDTGNPAVNALGVGLLAAPDLADTIASNKLVSWATGQHRGDLNQTLLNSIGQPGLNNFYHQHQAGIEATSGIGGLVATQLATEGLGNALRPALGAMKGVPFVRRIVGLDTEYANAMSTVRNVDMSLAQRGAIGIESYTGTAAVDTLKFDSKGSIFAPTALTTGRGQALLRAKGLGALMGVRNAAVQESVAYAVLNSNNFLYSDDASQNLAWQAVGVALGAGSEWYHSAYQARKFVNSDEVRRAFASALDPEGIEESRLLWGERQANPLRTNEGFLGGSYTDAITNLSSSAASLRQLPTGATDDARSLLATRDRLATQHEALAVETTQKVTIKGISSDNRTRFSLDTPYVGNHMTSALHADPTLLYGVEQMGAIPDGLTSEVVHQSHMQRLNERITAADEMLSGDEPISAKQREQLMQIRQRLDFESRLTPSVLIDSEKAPIDEAAAIEQYDEPKIQFNPENRGLVGQGTGVDKHGLFSASSPTSDGMNPVSVDTSFGFHIPHADINSSADHFKVLDLYRAANSAIERMRTFTGSVAMPANPHWFQLDMAEELLRREPTAKIMWLQGMNRDSAMVESLAQKAEAMQYWRKVQPNSLALSPDGLDSASQLSKLRVRFNLPRLTAYERGVTGADGHPVEQLLRGIDQFGPDDVRKMPLADIQQSMAEFKKLGDMVPVNGDDMDTLGKSFKYMLDSQGNPVKPVLMYSRPLNPLQWSQDVVAERLAARKMLAQSIMADPNTAAPLTRNLNELITTSPDFQLASSSHELVDTQVQGSTFGAAPQTFWGSAANAIKTSDWIGRDSPVLLAASRIRDQVERVSRDAMRTLIQGAFGDTLSLLKNPRNSASALLLNQFHSFRQGWDLESKTVARDDFHAFTLGDTTANRARWASQFPNLGEFKPGQTLLSPDGKEVVLDSVGLDLQQRFNQVSDALAAEKNTLLRANGMGQIDSANWYAPSPELRGKYVGFVYGPDNKPVPGMGIVASTPEEFASKQRAQIPKLNELGLGYVFRTQDDIKNFASIWDRAQMDMVSPGTTAIQPGKKGRGLLTGQDINMHAFEDSLQYLRDGFLQHGNDVTETIFKEQINAAKARSQIASNVTKNRALLNADLKYRNIYDMYQENLKGRSKINSTGSLVGRFYNPIEGGINEALAGLTPTAAYLASKTGAIWAATNGWINRFTPWSNSNAAKGDFDALSSALGPHMPFQSVAELMEARGVGAKPWTEQSIVSTINKFGAAMMLRMFEVAHPIMNLSGIIAAMPSVIRHYTPMEGEATADFAQRIGHSATIFNMPGGKSLAIPDIVKLGSQAFRDAWDVSRHADYDYMVRRGYITQEVAEFHRQFGAIESQSQWQKFFVGDSSITNPKGPIEYAKSRGVVGWLSTLSDKSEDLSRAWGHMIGLRLADEMGIDGIANRNVFAHDLANKMIANYSPHNRPEIFQGATGNLIGLFQSFTQEYWQRMFRYIETKDGQSLATQYAMQAGLFGVNSVPGFAQFNQFMTLASQKHTDPATSMQGVYGTSLGDLVGHGVLSNIPAMFGAPGVDLYSRGDTSIRTPAGLGNPNVVQGFIQGTPGLSIINRIGQGLVQGIQAFADANGTLTHTELTEILANMVANRPLAGVITEAFNHGDQIDHTGQIMSSTKNGMEMAYRLIGLRSERQSDEINAYYANKNAQAQRASQGAILNIATRAAMREGNYDVLPMIFEKYVDNGGDPRYYSRWLRNNYQAATTSRGERQLNQVLKDPNKMAQVSRLLDAGVSVSSDVKTPDPVSALNQADQGSELNQPTSTLGSYSGQMTFAPDSSVQQPEP